MPPRFDPRVLAERARRRKTKKLKRPRIPVEDGGTRIGGDEQYYRGKSSGAYDRAVAEQRRLVDKGADVQPIDPHRGKTWTSHNDPRNPPFGTHSGVPQSTRRRRRRRRVV